MIKDLQTNRRSIDKMRKFVIACGPLMIASTFTFNVTAAFATPMQSSPATVVKPAAKTSCRSEISNP